MPTVEHATVGLYGLKDDSRIVHVDEHRVVGGLGAGRPLPLARRVEFPTASPTNHVGNSLYRCRALVDVIVPREDHVDTVVSKQRLEVLPYLLVVAVPGRAIKGPMQEGEPPALARRGEVLLQEGPLLLGITAPVVVVELAVYGDEVGIAPVEGVETFGAARALKGRVEVVEVGGSVPVLDVMVAQHGEEGHLPDEGTVR